MSFVQENILLIVVAFVSGAMLLWPYVRRASAGPSVSPHQATQLINREDALVVDVREPGEFGSGHILGAKNVPLARIDAGGAEIAAKRKQKPVIVYCDTGSRSGKAAAVLRAQGFAQVLNLAGGLAAWRQAGLPVEK
ncbi:MAG TPA: rhodanese-like domain-containing protein [Burkholderiales bacterium]|nr:rhodanese-like domain-containing protein [Burkholderiales bacterium]